MANRSSAEIILNSTSRIAIEYNDVNNRVTNIAWSIGSGYSADCRIWNSGNLVVDRSVTGPATGTENVPGTVRMVEFAGVDGQTWLTLPDNITFVIEMRQT